MDHEQYTVFFHNLVALVDKAKGLEFNTRKVTQRLAAVMRASVLYGQADVSSLRASIDTARQLNKNKLTIWMRLMFGVAKGFSLILRDEVTNDEREALLAEMNELTDSHKHVEVQEQTSGYLLECQIEVLICALEHGITSSRVQRSLSELEVKLAATEDDLPYELDSLIHQLTQALIYAIKDRRNRPNAPVRIKKEEPEEAEDAVNGPEEEAAAHDNLVDLGEMEIEEPEENGATDRMDEAYDGEDEENHPRALNGKELAEARQRRESCLRYEPEDAKAVKQYPQLVADANLLISDLCVLGLNKSVNEAKTQMREVFEKIKLLEKYVKDAQDTNDMMVDGDDPALRSLFLLFNYFYKTTKRAKLGMISKLFFRIKVGGRAQEEVFVELRSKVNNVPMIVACTETGSLYVTLYSNLVPVRGGIEDAMLALVAIYYAFDFEFVEAAEVKEFFSRAIGLKLEEELDLKVATALIRAQL